MTTQDLMALCDRTVAEHGHLVFTDDEIRSLQADQIFALRDRFGARVLMKLPPSEIAFFEWVRTNDLPAWTDLWGGEDEPYLVSLAHLEDLAGATTTHAFVIRDLLGVDNYFFSPHLLIEKESDAFIGAVRERFTSNQSLTPAQLLALEASVGPVDIWHFAHRHNIPLDVAKRAVQQLVDDRILLHVTRADHLAQYFDVQ